VTFDDVFIGLHQTSSAVVAGTNRPVTSAAAAERHAEARAIALERRGTLPFAATRAAARWSGASSP